MKENSKDLLFERMEKVNPDFKKPLNEIMSEIPTNIDESNKDIDKEVLRAAMIAELDAINLYEQLAAKTSNEKVKKVLLDVAKEEKTHVGEFETMLKELDSEQVKELEQGEEEVEDLTNSEK